MVNTVGFFLDIMGERSLTQLTVLGKCSGAASDTGQWLKVVVH